MKRKRTLFLIVCLVIICIVTGCGTNPSHDQSNPSYSSSQAEIDVPKAEALSGDESGADTNTESGIQGEDAENKNGAAFTETAEVVEDAEIADAVETVAAAEAAEASESANAAGVEGSPGNNIQIVQTMPETTVLGGTIPQYSGDPSSVLNNDVPAIGDAANGLQEGDILLSAMDNLGRAGTAMMIAGPSSLPTGERGPTGQYKPSGWNQNKYPGVVDSEPPYLMNRSHLLMWALSGLTDTKENLISGTRYMNATGMLSIEEDVLRYIESSGDTVIYRVTPVYEGDNLLASGVFIEAEAVNGEYHLCRYVYNVQPGIEIDYKTGENHLADAALTPEVTEVSLNVYEYDFILNKKTFRFHKPSCDSVTEMKEKNREGFNGTAEELLAAGYDPCDRCCSEWVTLTPTPAPTVEPTPEPQPVGTDYVLNTNTRKFHRTGCGSVKQMKPHNTQYFNGTRDEVIGMGYEPCQNCNP